MTSSYDFLKKVELFAGLSDEDLDRLCDVVEEVCLSAGEELFAEGDPGDQAYVIKEGELEVIKKSVDRDVFLAIRKSGEVIGEMALLEDAPRSATIRCSMDSVLLAIHKEDLYHLLDTSSSAARVLFFTILERWRNTEALLRQSEKMAQLGTLSAGIAHELNNPAAAVVRGADQLRNAIEEFVRVNAEVGQLSLSAEQQIVLEEQTIRAEKRATETQELDALTRNDREYALETWLESRGIDNVWDIAPGLINLNYTESDLSKLAERFGPDEFVSVVSSVNTTYAVRNLLVEISQGAGRISGIVKALKSYSYLDQAPVQSVNVHEGLDDTLLILRSKLKSGISVRREYDPDLPVIHAYGSELNQVWTNIIDNAADALEGQGEIIIRTRQVGESVVVEIEDNGPGIPPEIQPRIFDSFFTTKPPGKGTGLGLDISHNIVVYKHRGEIKVQSQPGKTLFEVWLPLNFEAG